MSADVAIVDYGIGNLLSVRRAFEHCGASVVVSDDPQVLLGAPRLVLPGVGAFAAGMQALVQRKVVDFRGISTGFGHYRLESRDCTPIPVV